MRLWLRAERWVKAGEEKPLEKGLGGDGGLFGDLKKEVVKGGAETVWAGPGLGLWGRGVREKGI